MPLIILGALGSVNFVLVSVHWFDNAQPYTQQQTDVKDMLRQDGPTDFSLYAVGSASSHSMVILHSLYPTPLTRRMTASSAYMLQSHLAGTKAIRRGALTYTRGVLTKHHDRP